MLLCIPMGELFTIFYPMILTITNKRDILWCKHTLKLTVGLNTLKSPGASQPVINEAIKPVDLDGLDWQPHKQVIVNYINDLNMLPT